MNCPSCNQPTLSATTTLKKPRNTEIGLLSSVRFNNVPAKVCSDYEYCATLIFFEETMAVIDVVLSRMIDGTLPHQHIVDYREFADLAEAVNVSEHLVEESNEFEES